MPIIQTIQDKVDQYFEQRPASDGYDEVDAVFELVAALSDEELMLAIHEADLWSEVLREKVAGIAADSWAQTVRDLVVHVLVAEVMV